MRTTVIPTAVFACLVALMLTPEAQAQSSEPQSSEAIQTRERTEKGETSSLASGEESGLKSLANAPESQSPPRAIRRLPRYYGRLNLDDNQRSDIYAIQEKYYAKIDELQKRLDALKVQRNVEIQEVLSPEQARRLADLVAAAAANRRRASKVAAGTSPASGGKADMDDKPDQDP